MTHEGGTVVWETLVRSSDCYIYTTLQTDTDSRHFGGLSSKSELLRWVPSRVLAFTGNSYFGSRLTTQLKLDL